MEGENLKDGHLREIGALARIIHSINEVKFRGIGLQRGQFIFLTRVCERPGVNLAELSALLAVDKTTTTKAVQKLMAAGLVDRERDAADKRMWRLVPTAKGLAVYPRILAVCLAGFGREERAAALAMLRRMRGNIESDWLDRNTNRGEESCR
jgi:DNA-binding MarR family transcriptional regulator